MASKNPIHRARGKAVETHDGLYRVRDNHQSGGHVWGENLTWDAANHLKNQVLGARKSRTALVEPMDVPAAPPADPVLKKAKDAAMKAATGAASAANARQKARQPVSRMPPPPPPPPDGDDGFDLTDGEGPGDDEIDDSVVADIMGEIGGAPNADDLALANRQAEADFKKAQEEMANLVAKNAPIPSELVNRVGFVPEHYSKAEDGTWRFAPGSQ